MGMMADLDYSPAYEYLDNLAVTSNNYVSAVTIQPGITCVSDYLGVTTTALTDGSNINPITIGNKSITAKTGDIVIYEENEFVYSDTDNKWNSTDSLKTIKGYNSPEYTTGISFDFNDLLKRIIALENSKPEFVELKCKNCGGKIQQRYEDSIIKCPYCKSVYIIGRKQINDA